MPSINISEADFETVAMSAWRAKRAGDMDEAVKLDKIARKINAALTNAIPELKIGTFISGRRHVAKWQDMPSTIEDI